MASFRSSIRTSSDHGGSSRMHRGAVAHQSGVAAEACVERHYCASGRSITARRWRGMSGEIDLVAREGDAVVFVEVKRARTFEQAAQRVSERQMARIACSASEFLATLPQGQLTPARFDVALVDGTGRVEVLENAFGA